jgi:hypothetical protein
MQMIYPRGEEILRCGIEVEAAFKTDLEKLLKQEGHMPGGQVPGPHREST